jgi:hypothetical protein
LGDLVTGADGVGPLVAAVLAEGAAAGADGANGADLALGGLAVGVGAEGTATGTVILEVVDIPSTDTDTRLTRLRVSVEPNRLKYSNSSSSELYASITIFASDGALLLLASKYSIVISNLRSKVPSCNCRRSPMVLLFTDCSTSEKVNLSLAMPKPTASTVSIMCFFVAVSQSDKFAASSSTAIGERLITAMLVALADISIVADTGDNVLVGAETGAVLESRTDEGDTVVPLVLGAELALYKGPDGGAAGEVALIVEETVGAMVPYVPAGAVVGVPLKIGADTGEIFPSIGADTGASVVLEVPPVVIGAEVTFGSGPTGEVVEVALNIAEAAGAAVMFALAGSTVAVPFPTGAGDGNNVKLIGAETG